MSKTNDNNQPVAVGSKQPQAAPPTNEVFIRVGTTLYKVVDQPNISGGKVRKRIPWNMETLRHHGNRRGWRHRRGGLRAVPHHGGFHQAHAARKNGNAACLRASRQKSVYKQYYAGRLV